MDLIESSIFTPPIILLQTVMEEVRHRSLPLYNRLKALVKMDDKRTWVFYNEFRSCVTPPYYVRWLLTPQSVVKPPLFAKRKNLQTIETTAVWPPLCMRVAISNIGPRNSQGNVMVQHPHITITPARSWTNPTSITYRHPSHRRCRE